MSRASKEKSDIARAEREVAAQEEKLQDLEEEFRDAVADLRDGFAPEDIELQEIVVRPRKSDIGVEGLALQWVPWRVDSDGVAERAC